MTTVGFVCLFVCLFYNCGVFIITQMPKEREELSELRPELAHCRLPGPGPRQTGNLASLCGAPQTPRYKVQTLQCSALWTPAALSRLISFSLCFRLDPSLFAACGLFACPLSMLFPPWKCLFFLGSLLLVLQRPGHKFLSPWSLLTILTIWTISVCVFP